MASNAPLKSLAARASAVLTASEVAATRLDLTEVWGGAVSVHLDFTIGMLTNVIVKHYVSMDGTTYVPVASGSAVLTETITATGTRAYSLTGLGGWKFYRATLQGTGTVTNSLAALTYRYLRRASQG